MKLWDKKVFSLLTTGGFYYRTIQCNGVQGNTLLSSSTWQKAPRAGTGNDAAPCSVIASYIIINEGEMM